MEVLTLAGYTRDEKFHIAKRHLAPKAVAECGLADGALTFTDDALRAVIDGYTREAGVRQLERLLGRVGRKVARRVASGETGPVVVRAEDVESYLDLPVFQDEARAREPSVGVATGLAWTPGGGTVMFIEASAMPGKGHVHETGRLGDVMRESADLAMSWVRANSAEYGIAPDVFATHDVHLHVPEGATPKDGPSAGVTLVTALVSLFTEKPIRVDLAMTGELTLKGRVLPVGGIKEKVLAAHRAGIRRICLPEGNRRDLKDVPEEIRDEIDIRFTTDVRQNLAEALMAVMLPDAAKRRTLSPPSRPPSASGPNAVPPPA
jgi:ATP-dependent Lon protease